LSQESRGIDGREKPTCMTILLQYLSNSGSHSAQNILPAGGNSTQVTLDSRSTRSSSSEKVKGEGTNISSLSGIMSLIPHPYTSAQVTCQIMQCLYDFKTQIFREGLQTSDELVLLLKVFLHPLIPVGGHPQELVAIRFISVEGLATANTKKIIQLSVQSNLQTRSILMGANLCQCIWVIICIAKVVKSYLRSRSAMIECRFWSTSSLFGRSRTRVHWGPSTWYC
jgi:hypothetical protein